MQIISSAVQTREHTESPIRHNKRDSRRSAKLGAGNVRIIFICSDSVQREFWRRECEREQLELRAFRSIWCPDVDFWRSEVYTPIFLEIPFGELCHRHPAHEMLRLLGCKHIVPVREHCVPSEAIRFASFLLRWQNEA